MLSLGDTTDLNLEKPKSGLTRSGQPGTLTVFMAGKINNFGDWVKEKDRSFHSNSFDAFCWHVVHTNFPFCPPPGGFIIDCLRNDRRFYYWRLCLKLCTIPSLYFIKFYILFFSINHLLFWSSVISVTSETSTFYTHLLDELRQLSLMSKWFLRLQFQGVYIHGRHTRRWYWC